VRHLDPGGLFARREAGAEIHLGGSSDSRSAAMAVSLAGGGLELHMKKQKLPGSSLLAGFVVGTLSMTSACGHGAGSASPTDAGAIDANLGPPFGPVALADYTAKTREAYCRWLVRCGELPDLASCAQVNLRLIVIPPANPAEVAAGKTIYDPVQSGLCIDATATASCDRTSPWVVAEACLHQVTGTLHADASCETDAECISGRCDKQAPQCHDGCCTGSCVGDTPPALAGLGADCEYAWCDRDTYCDPQLLTCQPLKPSGAPCNGEHQCVDGLECDRALPQDSPTCQVPPRLGDLCYERVSCAEEGTFCSLATGRCEKQALGGQSCRETQCSPVYRCDAMTATCSAGLATGAACGSISLCADPNGFCDMAPGQSTGVCAVRQPDGAPCTSSRYCQSGGCDASQHCAPPTFCE
jgi:hypothetical protein